MEIPSCPSPCYLDDLIVAMDDLIPRDLAEECQLVEDGAPGILRLEASGIGLPMPQQQQSPFTCPKTSTDDPLSK